MTRFHRSRERAFPYCTRTRVHFQHASGIPGKKMLSHDDDRCRRQSNNNVVLTLNSHLAAVIISNHDYTETMATERQQRTATITKQKTLPDSNRDQTAMGPRKNSISYQVPGKPWKVAHSRLSRPSSVLAI